MTRKVVLVTGADGFIGRWSVAPLIERGYEVHAVAGRAGHHPVPAQLQAARIHRADLLDPAAVEALVRAVEPSHLLHFAWIATPGLYWTSPENERWVAAGEHLLLGFVAGGGARAVMAGSCAEYDWSRVSVCEERSSPLARGAGLTAYAASKLAMQAVLARVGTEHGLSNAWGRIFFQFGPDEHPERLVASVILNLLRGREAPCTHGRQIRSFLHVADVGAAFAALLDGAAQGPVNIGSGERLSLAQLLEYIGLQIGRPELVKLGARAAPPSEPPVLVPDVERLRDEVGWQPRFTLAAGLADTIAWWRAVLTVGGEAPN
jgi:nucleoside-diphosphate-sugar epimerase